MKSDPSNIVWDEVFIKHRPIVDKQKCLKQTFEESHMKSDLSNMVLTCAGTVQ